MYICLTCTQLIISKRVQLCLHSCSLPIEYIKKIWSVLIPLSFLIAYSYWNWVGSSYWNWVGSKEVHLTMLNKVVS